MPSAQSQPSFRLERVSEEAIAEVLERALLDEEEDWAVSDVRRSREF